MIVWTRGRGVRARGCGGLGCGALLVLSLAVFLVVLVVSGGHCAVFVFP